MKEEAPGMAVKGMGCSGFSTAGCGSGRFSSPPPSSSPDRVLLAGGREPSRSLLRATSGARASTDVDRTPSGKYLKGEAAKPGCGREGEAGREEEEWMDCIAEGGKRVGGRENCEGGV